jgi:transmembrane sensor
MTTAILDGPGSRRRPGASYRLLIAAACILILVALATTWHQFADKSYAAAVGEQRRIQLADGSRLILDADSAATVRITRDARTVRLTRGRALFEVAHDIRRPFAVTTKGIETRALGTRFAVSSRDGLVTVTLLQGSVEVRDRRGAANVRSRLTPGQQLVVTDRDRHARIATADLTAATGWTEGHLIFRNVRLKDAVEEVNRYSRRKVVLASSDLAELRVSGFFDAGDTASFAAAVAEMFALRDNRADDGSMMLTR